MRASDFHLFAVAIFASGVAFALMLVWFTWGPVNIAAWGQLGDTINPVLTLVAVCVAIQSWRISHQTKDAERLREIRSSSYEVTLSEIRERAFKMRQGRKFPYNVEVGTLREAKTFARNFAKDDEQHWNSDVQDKWNKEVEKGGWAEDVAFEVGDSLQQLGVLSATGALPLDVTLMHVAIAIVNDWLLCSHWIKSYQIKSDVKRVVRGQDDYFHRRHAEWLAMIAIAHMRKFGWNIDALYPDNACLPVADDLTKRLLLISDGDGWAIPKDVCDQVRRLTGISIHGLSRHR